MSNKSQLYSNLSILIICLINNRLELHSVDKTLFKILSVHNCLSLKTKQEKAQLNMLLYTNGMFTMLKK